MLEIQALSKQNKEYLLYTMNSSIIIIIIMVDDDIH